MVDFCNPATPVHHAVEEIQAEIGDGLQALARGRIETAEYDLVFLRDDLQGEYSDETAREIALRALGERYLEVGEEDPYVDNFGQFREAVRLYDDTTLIFVRNEQTMLGVALEPQVDLISPVLNTIRGTFLEHEQ